VAAHTTATPIAVSAMTAAISDQSMWRNTDDRDTARENIDRLRVLNAPARGPP
jgi:hypothetical protein